MAEPKDNQMMFPENPEPWAEGNDLGARTTQGNEPGGAPVQAKPETAAPGRLCKRSKNHIFPCDNMTDIVYNRT